MSERLSLADQNALLALPERMRRQIMALVRESYLSGYDAAKRTAESDAETGCDWLSVPQARAAYCGLWLEAEASPLLGVPSGIGYDDLYAIPSRIATMEV